MDTSETYIKMCEKAEEIQGLRHEEKHRSTGKWLDGDFYGSVLDNLVFVATTSNDAWADEPYYIHHPSEATWLPRQDQLQEMVGKEYPMPFFSLVDFVLEHEDPDESKSAEEVDDNPLLTNLTSMEQLWLAFVMKEGYEKVWDGNDWIKT